MPSGRHDAIVIGAGQCGLAAAYYLRRQGLDFVVLEANQRVGDQWRNRYDSLRLYSPAKYDALPGLDLPMPGHTFPTGREMGDYLEAYVAHHQLPVETGVGVDRLSRLDAAGRGYEVRAGDRVYYADQVIVAGGFFRRPHLPAFASELDPGIRQLHSADYRRPDQLRDGPVLVVGLSHSGADLAIESVASGHPTILSGKGHGQLPFSVDSRMGRMAWPFLRFIAWNLLTIRTPIGRKMASVIRSNGGAPLLRYRRADLVRAGVELTEARTVGVTDGRPTLDDGRVLDVANVIWCTGFRPDYGWIELPVFDEAGYPRERRGVAEAEPGVYFLGVLFQYGFTSMLVGGAARDAAHVVDRLADRAGELARGHASRTMSEVAR